jgi:precorrin-2 dehydrogenase/sirohydrochlorin ferrochelatase
VQKQVIEEANVHDILLNCANIPDACSFQVPAMVRQGDLLLAISTSGGSPALSAWIRKRLALEYGVEYGLLVDLFASIRAEVLNDGSSSGSHKRVFEKILETDTLACLRNRDWAALQAELALCLPKSIDIPALVADLSTREPTDIQFVPCKDHDE